jgi:hypothetical protein
MDEALQKTCASFRVDRIAIKIIFHDVFGLDERGGEQARHQKSLRILGMARADVTESIKHALRGQDVVGDHEISDQRGTFF